MDETVRGVLESRLVVLEALLAAQSRREEVMAEVAAAQDADEAAARLVRLLDVDREGGAVAVHDVEVRSWTVEERERIERCGRRPSPS